MWTEGLTYRSLCRRRSLSEKNELMIHSQRWVGWCYVLREGTMGMQVTQAHSQPDTTITGPSGQQRAKAFHTPPNMAFTPSVQDTAEL